ncbi:MAG: hypothetical protein KKD44_10870 [Proteobacteria bacterium]|nr:hypothetical protein [Pseudomonadota bacterium]
MKHRTDAMKCDMTYPRAKTLKLLAASFLLMAMGVGLWSCSSGSDPVGDQTAPVSPASGIFTGKATIGSSSGGAISVETNDGILVILDIPEKALEHPNEITLTVTQTAQGSAKHITKSDDSEFPSEFDITITPGISLMEPAQLTVVYPQGIDGSGMILCRSGVGLLPLKQGMTSGSLTGSLYRLGNFVCQAPVDDEFITSAYNLIGLTPDGSWQEAFTTFDALVFLSAYMAQHGYTVESADCFGAVVEQSKKSVGTFLDAIGLVEKGSYDFKSLDKFKHLMVLCENPANIIAELDGHIESYDVD